VFGDFQGDGLAAYVSRRAQVKRQNTLRWAFAGVCKLREDFKPRFAFQQCTVRLSNLSWDPKMGVFLQSTEATPCGHFLKWKLTPKKPPCGHHVHGRLGHGYPVKNR
jgi:hypothetical protein